MQAGVEAFECIASPPATLRGRPGEDSPPGMRRDSALEVRALGSRRLCDETEDPAKLASPKADCFAVDPRKLRNQFPHRRATKEASRLKLRGNRGAF